MQHPQARLRIFFAQTTAAFIISGSAQACKDRQIIKA
jgi:hypothetical protein